VSIPFNDTVNYTGIIQLIERNLGFNPGDISGNPTLLLQFTADVNLGLDDAWATILQSSGEWTLDDTNFSDYPIITANLNSGQYDYPFVTDGSGNIILEIFRVMVMDTSGIFHEIYPISEKTTTQKTGNPISTDSIINEGNANADAVGIPQRYDKTGNSILLDPIPNYNQTGGLKVFIDREASYFASQDTTKKPGFAGIFHEYLALYASSYYADRKSFVSAKALMTRTMNMKRAIQEYYVKRDKDTPRRLRANVEATR
jgi:hypothetical protein